MKSPLLSAKLLVKKSSVHGYGVFADQDIQTGEIIEECYSLFTKGQETDFNNYYFAAGDKSVLACGYGSIYNHSHQPNANYEFDPAHSLVIFHANQFIKQGEEIFIDYGKNWFGPRGLKQKEPSLRFKLRKLLPATLMLMRFAIVVGALFAVMRMMIFISMALP